MYVATLALRHLPFGATWTSSAKNLSDDLARRAIVLHEKLYYEYKLPYGLKQSEFMQKYAIEFFCNNFFGQFSGHVIRDKKLTVRDKIDVIKYVLAMRRKKSPTLQEYEKQIRKLNPELSEIAANTPHSIVYGAMFGFAPGEIAYFADTAHRNLSREDEVINLLQKRYGIKLTYVLSPKTAKMVIDALEHSEINSKER